ncbi:MAG: preprotein translocase subunit SecY [Phycisphaerae bacterium]|nr:preprotein translocase subunit SecY [Tepidisphaeraceae bacterium]
MFKTLINIFRVPELRNKVLFTLFMLAIYRIGYHVPLPGVDQESFAEQANPGQREVKQAERALRAAKDNLKQVEGQYGVNSTEAGNAKNAVDDAQKKFDAARRDQQARQQANQQSAAGKLAAYVSLFSGGNLSQSTVFGLGIMPYISASIIFQLLTTVTPALEKLQKEGETGRRKIQEWTRYATVPLCIVQAIFWISYMHNQEIQGPGGTHSLVQQSFAGTMRFWVMSVFALTAGCIFLMWLGEQIDEYGLGNGISLIILAGIVSRVPTAIFMLYQESRVEAAQGGGGAVFGKVVFLMVSFVFIVAGSILITQAQRRIPVQQAKHTRGRRVYGGSRQYLPLRVNHGGVMPIIFAQSLMLFPGMLFGWLAGTFPNAGAIQWLNGEFTRGGYLYLLLEAVMIYFFAYFWTTVQFQPKEMANQLRDYGSFIPGLRPGKRTADYLEKVMMRITYVGAAFLCLIAVIPSAISSALHINPMVAQFLGGTGLLIVVSVALDMVQRIEANLLMRNYGGFLSAPGGGKGKRIKGRQY